MVLIGSFNTEFSSIISPIPITILTLDSDGRNKSVTWQNGECCATFGTGPKLKAHRFGKTRDETTELIFTDFSTDFQIKRINREVRRAGWL